MPAGLDVTGPAADAGLASTVSVKRFSMKMALTDRAFAIVTVQVAPDTESHPVQPVKQRIGAGRGGQRHLRVADERRRAGRRTLDAGGRRRHRAASVALSDDAPASSIALTVTIDAAGVAEGIGHADRRRCRG
mgnify:CR=1 FL=1